MPKSSAFNFSGERPRASYDDILNTDSRAVPSYLRQGPAPDLGTAPVSAARYYDPGFFAAETARLWPRAWQWACREEQIPQPGDYLVYENAGQSFIIVRTDAQTIRAFYNACLHRGRKLVSGAGCRQEFRCPYHGISWAPDGRLKDNPLAWDLPQWRDKDFSLPQAKLARWGGFIFINPDPDAPPFETILGRMADDFARFNLAERRAVFHVSKKIRANWKIAAEAFMESHHTVTTHPQILQGLADMNSQYDILNDHVSRQFSAAAVASPMLRDPPSEAEIAAHMLARGGARTVLADTAMPSLPEGRTARGFLAEISREAMRAQTGGDCDAASDAEMLDALLYNIFPHFCLWASYPANVVYRWRPYALDPEASVMDVLVLKPVRDGDTSPYPPIRELDFDQPWSDATEMGTVSRIFDQDMSNLAMVQSGLRASRTQEVHFTEYAERRIRKFHQMIDRYIAQV
jgi:phenylpropionate dioxygenase-like ring-hydroxylating dioxygenase large terminal subunit